MSEEISFNPFKMWGTYLGWFIALLIPINLGLLGTASIGFLLIYSLIHGTIFSTIYAPVVFLMLLLVTFIVGGTIGYAIHSLFRFIWGWFD